MPSPASVELQIHLPRLDSGGHYLVAYSGGLDSTVLLHLLATHSPRLPLRAAHVHHGLQSAAGKWAEHCGQVCRRLEVPLAQLKVTPATGPRKSLEAEARSARYIALRGEMRLGDVLLTAHHLDDQAETLMLQLLRGAGPRGLAAMPAVSEFPPGLHARPLLAYARSRLKAYAEAHGLDWIEDPSNTDRSHSRNFLRHEVMPRLREHWPSMAAMLGRSAALSAEAAELLDGQAEEDLEWCIGPAPGSLMIPALKQLSPARRRNLLRSWIDWLGLPLPEAQHFGHIESEILDAAVDATPLLAWPGVELRRYRDRLFASAPLCPVDPDWQMAWMPMPGQAEVLPAESGRLEAIPAHEGPRLREPQKGESPCLRWAREGERLKLAGQSQHRTLKNLCQEAGIPPWLRRRLPVLLYGDSIAAVADRWICAGFTAAEGETGWRLVWRDPPSGYPQP